MARVVLFTSGVPLLFFSVLIGLFAWALAMGLIQFFDEGNLLFVALGLVVFGWPIYFLWSFIGANRLVLDRGILVYSVYKWPKGLREQLVVRPCVERVWVRDVKEVVLGKAEHFDRVAKESGNCFLGEEMRPLKEATMAYGGIPLNVWFATKRIPLIYIVEKNGKEHMISTKAFGRKGIGKLLAELERQKVPVRVEGVKCIP